MKIRKFKAENSSIGMQMIRAAMGDDASILACYEVAGGVEFIVTGDDLSAMVTAKGLPVDAAASAAGRAEAIAKAVTPADQIARRQENLRHLGLASDTSSAGSSAALLMRNSKSRSADSRVKTAAVLTPAAPNHAREKPVRDNAAQADMLALKQELGSIRHWLENHLRQRTVASHEALPEPWQQWADALGLSNQWLLAKPAISDAMKAGVSPAQALNDALLASTHCAELPDRGVVFVVGPSGAGKTTLVNKLVMSDIRRHGHGGVTLITTDGNRLGAQEQLRAAGRVLDVPVHSAFTPDDLRETLARLSHERLVIVDTAGLQAHQEASLRTLAMQLAIAPTAEVILALPSDADLRSVEALMSRVAGLPISAVALTRVDMSCVIAPRLALLGDYGLPLAAINQSPRMIDGIEAASESLTVLVAGAMVQADALINPDHEPPASARMA